MTEFYSLPNTICLCNLSWLVSCSLWSNEIPEGWLTFYLFSLICETREIKTVTTSNYSSDILSVPNIFSRLAVNRTFYFNTFSQNTSFALWEKKCNCWWKGCFSKIKKQLIYIIACWTVCHNVPDFHFLLLGNRISRMAAKVRERHYTIKQKSRDTSGSHLNYYRCSFLGCLLMRQNISTDL